MLLHEYFWGTFFWSGIAGSVGMTLTVLVSYMQTSETGCSVSDVSCYYPRGNYY